MAEEFGWKWVEVGKKEAERLWALVRAALPSAVLPAMPEGSCALRYLEEGPGGVVAREGMYLGELGRGDGGDAYYLLFRREGTQVAASLCRLYSIAGGAARIFYCDPFRGREFVLFLRRMDELLASLLRGRAGGAGGAVGGAGEGEGQGDASVRGRAPGHDGE